MGKSLDDLQLSDAPLVRAQPPDPHATEWYAFQQEIDELLEGGGVDWARETLKGIAHSVEQFQRVTPGQRQAVHNIGAARGRVSGWARRYDGFDR